MEDLAYAGLRDHLDQRRDSDQQRNTPCPSRAPAPEDGSEQDRGSKCRCRPEERVIDRAQRVEPSRAQGVEARGNVTVDPTRPSSAVGGPQQGEACSTREREPSQHARSRYRRRFHIGSLGISRRNRIATHARRGNAGRESASARDGDCDVNEASKSRVLADRLEEAVNRALMLVGPPEGGRESGVSERPETHEGRNSAGAQLSD